MPVCIILITKYAKENLLFVLHICETLKLCSLLYNITAI